MARVLAAIGEGPMRSATARVARRLSERLGVDLGGIHIRGPSSPDAGTLSRLAGLPVDVRSGDVVPSIVEAMDADDVILAVIAAREQPDGGEVGHVALRVMQETSSPLLVVPGIPDAGRRALQRALVPLDGDPHTSAQVRRLVGLLGNRGVELVAVHVVDPRRPPRLLDASGHGLEAWRREFLCRYARPVSRLELRRGTTWPATYACAGDVAADLVVLAWSQCLEAGHAAVVREAITNPRLPVLLVPEGADPSGGA